MTHGFVYPVEPQLVEEIAVNTKRIADALEKLAQHTENISWGLRDLNENVWRMRSNQ